MSKNPLDTIVGYSIDRIAYARNAWMRAFSDSRRYLPQYLEDDTSVADYVSISNNNEQQRRAATTISWVYSDIRLLANEVSAANIEIFEKVGEKKNQIENHPIEVLLDRPNDDITGIFLLQYTMWWMQILGRAFWFLLPEQGNYQNIAAIWPMQANRVKVVRGKNQFIQKYRYRTDRGKFIDIPPQYVVYFRYPDPYDLWGSLAPLDAGFLPLQTDQAEAKWQRDTFVSGKGIPHSIILLDPNMGQRDFEEAAARIREDFQNERKIAIARGGDMKVSTVGVTPAQLSLIESRAFSRDEIDTIFLGIAYHAMTSEAGLKVADKMLKEKIVYPLHRLLAQQFTSQFVIPYFGEQYLAEFEDIRPQDRSLDLQEFNIYKAGMTINEAREKIKLDKIKDPDRMPGLGKLLVSLATNPNFVLAYYGLQGKGPAGQLPETGKKKETGGNPSLPESDNQFNQTEREAGRGNEQNLLSSPKEETNQEE